MTISTNPDIEVYYPDTDSQPMAESDYQRPYIVYGTEVLDIFFADQPNVYVSGNILIYYEAGNPSACISPDVFVVMNRPKGKRSSYKVWQEDNCYPDFVLEITSKSTASQDQSTKRNIYASWGVREYFQYDPTSDYLEPPLQGYRLMNGKYSRIIPSYSFEGDLSLTSEVLGLELRLIEGEMRFYNPVTGEKLLTHRETEAARRIVEEAYRKAEIARQISENKVQRLADRLRELGIDPDEI